MQMNSRAPKSLLVVLIVAIAVLGRCGPGEAEEASLLRYWKRYQASPLDYVIAKFATHKWVFLGEYHRIKHDVDLVASLIPALHEKTRVRCLAWEFLGHEAADEANRLITAPEYDRGAMIAFFRRQAVTWSYEEYLNVYRAAWESNKRLADEKGSFLFVGLHPGIRWDLINYGTEEEAARERAKQEGYDELMARWLEEDVLTPGRPALIYTGIAHSTAKFDEYYVGQKSRRLVRMGNMVYKDPYKRNMCFVALHAPFYDSGTRTDIYPFDGILDRLMKSYRKDIGFDVTGTPFAGLTHKDRSEYSITAYAFGDLYDGYIMFKTPIKECVGMTCIPDWITTEADFEYYWRNIPNKEASVEFSKIPFEEFRKTFCTGNPDYGEGFKRRFRRLPDVE